MKIYIYLFSIPVPTYRFTQEYEPPKSNTSEEIVENFAPQNITVECKEQDLNAGHLPKWVWTAYPQYRYSSAISNDPQVMVEDVIPGCIDPTFCETNPPVPSQPPDYILPVDRSSSGGVRYTKPKRGSMRYDDGEVVLYKCINPSKYSVTQETTVAQFHNKFY